VTRPPDPLEQGFGREKEGAEQDRLVRMVLDRGGHPLHLPLTKILPGAGQDRLRRELSRLSEYDWLLLTSARAIPYLLDGMGEVGLSPEGVRATGVRIGAVGPRSAEALALVGLTPDLVPARFHAAALVEALQEWIGSQGRVETGGARILFPRAEEGRELIPLELERAGARVTVIPLYRSVPLPEAAEELARAVVEREVDLVTFTAGSAVRAFASAWRRLGARIGVMEFPPEVGVLALGPAVAEVLEEEGLPLSLVGEPHTLEGLVAGAEQWWWGR